MISPRRSGRSLRRYYTADPVVLVALMLVAMVIGFSVVALQSTVNLEGRVFGAVVAVLALGHLIRWSRVGVYLTTSGLRIVNVFSTHFVPFGTIEDVVLERTKRGGLALVVVRRDGLRIPAAGVQHRWLSSVEAAQRGKAGDVVRRVRKEVDVRRSSSEG